MALNQTTQTSAEHPHAHLGPFEAWMLDAGRYYDLPGLMLDEAVSLSCVAEFATPVRYADFLASAAATSGLLQGRMRLPTLDGDASCFIPFVLSPDASGAALTGAMAETIKALLGTGGAGAGAQLRLNFPIRQETLNPGFGAQAVRACSPDPVTATDPPTVILAVIDLGIPFAHANFRHAGGGTRIDYCWAQTAPFTAGQPGCAGDVLFGREFSRPEIDALLAAQGGDEEEVYRAAGLLARPGGPPMPLGRSLSHGAHVLDTLAGRWDAATAAQARIIAVDLPATATWETSGFGSEMFVLSALHYIFDRADRIARAHGTGPLPLVINLSYGYSGGPHDGSGLIEAAMDDLLAARNRIAPTALVMPSGNMFQDRLYALLTDAHFAPATGGRAAALRWFVPPADRTSTYLEMWYPVGSAPADVRVELTPPGSAPLPVFAPGADADFFAANIEVAGTIIGQFTIDRHRGQGSAGRLRATVVLAPTEGPAGLDLPGLTGKPHAPAAAGLWTVRFLLPDGTPLPGQGQSDGTATLPPGIDCRIQRDTSYGQGNTGAQQSYFVDPAQPRHDAMGKLAQVDETASQASLLRFGSLNGMATAPGTLVVGGNTISDRRAAIYSGAGPDIRGQGVDVSAPAERSAVAPGMVAAGTRSGVTFAAQGTSTSAPQIARVLAQALAATGERPADVPGCLALLATLPNMGMVAGTDDGPLGQRRLGKLVLDRPDIRDRTWV